MNFTTGVLNRVSEDRLRINNFVDNLIASRLTYIFTSDTPYNETVRHVRKLMETHPQLDILPILQRHRMYFETKVKEVDDNVW